MTLTAADAATIRVQRADLSRAKPPRWAWDKRVAIGYLNLLLGNEGVGKGTLICWLLAELTHGRLPGDLRGVASTVAVICDEDSWDDVWTPRLHAAGADLERVVRFERGDRDSIALGESRDQIAAHVAEFAIRALFFDALIDNLGADVDDWRSKQVRHALQPFRRLAQDAGIALIGSMHPNKRADSFRQLVAGSTAFNAVSRSSLLLAEHPEDETRRVLLRGKGNLSGAPTPIEFTLGTKAFAANGHMFSTPVATDFSRSTVEIADLIGEPAGGKPVEHSKVNDAATLIGQQLPRDGKWHPARAILDALETADIDEKTARRARSRLDIEHRRAPGAFPSPTEWRWPTTDAHRTSVESVQSGRSVRSATADTTDTPDTKNTPTRDVRSANGRPPLNALVADVQDGEW